ncbi:MAG: TlpA family protein disulfide reductase [Quinella sp. 3Q1]|nr:TlpA family protein disulfide reductase [Quinella sp. 3Q1]MBR6887434.1 TlpA family protein disulfide reductase [Selenomonadaceae bacterium]
MFKKIFALIFLGAAIFMSGCSDSADVNDSPKTAQASPVAKNIPNFSATTIKGEPVTNEIFAAKKITVVNIWGTFCPPCIAEMPELGEMARSMPADAQIIGLVCDASENSPQIQKALQITQEAGANFTNIVPDAQLMNFMAGVEAVPTTIFVNSKGEVVGRAIIGADVEGYKDELEKLLKQ